MKNTALCDFYTWLTHKEPKLYTFVAVTAHKYTMRKHKYLQSQVDTSPRRTWTAETQRAPQQASIFAIRLGDFGKYRF